MITNIRLQNFRSYRDESFEFEDGVNVVVGPNGSGKTNLLEAILVLAAGKSFRLPLARLKKNNKDWYRLDGVFSAGERTLKLKDSDKEFIIGQTYRRLPARLNFPIVLFEPEHLQLISGEPARRREWLDRIGGINNPQLIKTLGSYKRVLAQRNSLLKRNPTHIKDQIFAWDIRLSELGGMIAAGRQQTIDEINKKITKPYNHIAGKRHSVSVKYKSDFPAKVYASHFLSKLGASLNEDIRRGFTGNGPHREEVQFFLNGKILSDTASRGEARSLLLALKILEKELIERTSEQKPIILLDDVFSELDGHRRSALVEYLKGYQTIITTTDADAAIEHFGKKANLIALQGKG